MEQTFFLKSHILAGEPKLPENASWDGLAWLNPEEIESRLRAQGDELYWEGIKGMFGIPAIPVSDIIGVEHDIMSEA